MSSQQQDMGALFGFFNEIGIISQLAGNAFEKAMPAGMTLAQFSVLNHLCRLGDGWTPHRIARAMQVTKGAMTGTLRHLEAKGLIVVTPDQKDGRSKRVAITEDGRAMREACIGSMAPMLADFAGAFSVAEIAGIVPVLAAVRAWLDERRAES